MLLLVLLLAVVRFVAGSDSFTHNTTGQVLHGYRTGRIEDGLAVVYTIQQGFTKLDLSEWVVSMNHLGRKHQVVVISLDGPLDLQVVSEALHRAISEASEAGAVLILLEIDSPGGRTEYIERLCDLIIRIDYCPVTAFVRGGRFGGALSGASAVALACDKICMAPNTTIGAASLVKSYSAVSEDRLSIAWEQYLAWLAQRRNCPGLLARAMVDKDISVIEIIRDGKRLFIDPAEKEPNDVFVSRWTESGSLLTLTAVEAVQCGIAESVVADRSELLQKIGAASAEIVVRDDAAEAERTFRKAKLKFARLRRSLDANIKQLELTESMPQAITLLREVKEQYKSLLLLARRYRDLYLDTELIEQQLNKAESYYEKAKYKQRELDANEAEDGRAVQ
jgi:membrane-bound ClpP family serine protease